MRRSPEDTVYASNTIWAMPSTEVKQAPGRFRCGITMVTGDQNFDAHVTDENKLTRTTAGQPVLWTRESSSQSRSNLWLTTSLQFGATNEKVSPILYFYVFFI